MATRSHADALLRAGLPTVETLTRRILRVFDAATPSDIEHGARWYDQSTEIAVALSERFGYTLEQTSGVMSALSPRTPWARNLAGAVRLIADYNDVMPGLIGRNVENAQRIIDGEENVLRGPKTRAFAANIAGDREAVTVDVWAARVAGIDEDLLGRVGVYDAIAHAYRLAARRRGVDPATMQATTWIIARNGRAS